METIDLTPVGCLTPEGRARVGLGVCALLTERIAPTIVRRVPSVRGEAHEPLPPPPLLLR